MALLAPIENALAQVAAVVEGVQMPAWVERDGRKLPLLPGMELRAGDQVVTGAGSRIAVKLAEGSLVKLGENGQLRFTEISMTRELFKAALGVLEGAFRFTTEVATKNRKREVNIRASQVTAGIRGTDVWGRSRAGNEIVCLIEGEVEVVAEGEQPVTMNQPLQFYRRVDGKTLPIGVVDQEQLKRWSSEVDLQAGKGLARRGGRSSVTLASFDEQGGALTLADQLQSAGYPAEIRPEKSGDKVAYFVRIRQLASRTEAQALADQLRGKFGITEPKVPR
jgi:uncharacterized cupin superfamily protein